SEPDESGGVKVCVFNPTLSPVTLPKGTTIAKFEPAIPIKLSDVKPQASETDCPSINTVDVNSTSEGNQRRPPTTVQEAIDHIMARNTYLSEKEKQDLKEVLLEY